MHKHPRTIGKIIFVSLLATTLYANEEIADYRHESMEAIGAHFSAARKILIGEVPYQEHLPIHANALADMAGVLPSMFTEGSEGGEALDRIWDEPDKFSEKVSAFQEAARKFKEAVDSGESDEISQSFRRMGGSCKGCHDDYRE